MEEKREAKQFKKWLDKKNLISADVT